MDPNLVPDNPGTPEGQPEATPEPQPEATPEPVEVPLVDRMSALEEQNRSLQHKLTQQGRDRKAAEVVASPEPAPTEEFDWNNPAKAIGQAVGKQFGEYEARQEQRRQSDEAKDDVLNEYGIPKDQYNAYYSRLQEAAESGDPRELHRTVARMWRAENADKAITDAQNATQQTLERNARATTSTGGPIGPTVEEKSPAEMSDEELDAHVKSKYGVADWPG